MKAESKKNGSPFGIHRVIEPLGGFPQPAEKIDNNTEILWDNEILIDVETLNIDSASFTQIKNETGGDSQKIKEKIFSIIEKRGKMHNPVTGSGGMLIGTIKSLGEKIAQQQDLSIGDKIATLVSLSLTPLNLKEIKDIKIDTDQVHVTAEAILFESGIYAKLPEDIPEILSLAILDVAGAPAQTARLVKPGDTVAIFGATGKSGILCAYIAQRLAGPDGKIIGIGHTDKKLKNLEKLGLCHDLISLNATNASDCYNTIHKITKGTMADLVINCVNIPNTELSSILICKDHGIVYFFSMATSFTKAALGAEGIGKDVTMIIGNGYAQGHAEYALNIIRESDEIRELYSQIYC